MNFSGFLHFRGQLQHFGPNSRSFRWILGQFFLDIQTFWKKYICQNFNFVEVLTYWLIVCFFVFLYFFVKKNFYQHFNFKLTILRSFGWIFCVIFLYFHTFKKIVFVQIFSLEVIFNIFRSFLWICRWLFIFSKFSIFLNVKKFLLLGLFVYFGVIFRVSTLRWETNAPKYETTIEDCGCSFWTSEGTLLYLLVKIPQRLRVLFYQNGDNGAGWLAGWLG